MTVGDIRSPYFVGVCIIHCPCSRCTYREGDKAIFRLKKDVYNTITSNNLPTSVMCKYMSHTTYEVAEFSGDVGHRCQI